MKPKTLKKVQQLIEKIKATTLINIERERDLTDIIFGVNDWTYHIV